MNTTKNKGNKKAYRSVSEFERKFFRKAFEKKMTKKPADAQAIGASLAKETLEKVKGTLLGKLPS